MKRVCNMHVKGYHIVPDVWKNKTLPGVHRLYYIESGKAEYLENGIMYPFEVGKLYFIPSYAEVSTYTSDKERLNHAYATFELFPPIVSMNVFCLDPATSPKLMAALNIFEELCIEPYNSKYDVHLSVEEQRDMKLLEELTVYFVESAASAYADYIINDPTVLHALEIIHNSLNERLTVEDISKRMYMSTDGFIRKFKRYIGETPYSYIKKMKVRKAHVLRTEGATLDETALECGYSDSSALLHAISSVKPGK